MARVVVMVKLPFISELSDDEYAVLLVGIFLGSMFMALWVLLGVWLGITPC